MLKDRDPQGDPIPPGNSERSPNPRPNDLPPPEEERSPFSQIRSDDPFLPGDVAESEPPPGERGW
jgi:hypothetical protein